MNLRDFAYCPYCAAALETREVFQRVRPVCPDCGFIHFRDPKVAVIGVVTWRDQLLLIRRDVEPMRGRWALPGGYMDAGEMPQEALTRELEEEVGLVVDVGPLLAIYPMAGPGVVNAGIVLAFGAEVTGTVPPNLTCQDDVCEAGWFAADRVPQDLAFESTMALVAEWKQSNHGS